MDFSVKPYNEFKNSRNIPNLDGLRAIAILLVIFHHSPPFPYAIIENLQKNGNLGVQLFFILSGFLICTLFIREEEDYGKISIKNFYIRRTLRLFPLYYLVLFIESVLVFGFDIYSPLNKEIFEDKFLSYLFYYSNLLKEYAKGPFFVSWSLAAEEQFYLFFAPMFFFLKKQTIAIIFSILILIKSWIIIFHTDLYIVNNTENIFLRYQETIMLGVLLAMFLSVKKNYEIFTGLLSNKVFLFISLLTIILLFDRYFHRTYFYFVLTLFVGGCVTHRKIFLLDNPVLNHIGKISYGIYLFHMIVLAGTKKIIDDPLLVFIFTTLLVILVASISYQYFESPFLRLKRKFAPDDHR